MIVGYARTSTADQTAGLEAQITELGAQGCERVFSEHGSGRDAERPQFRAALDFLRAGDVFVVTRPDRMARSATDLLLTVRGLEARGVAVRLLSLGMDTATPTGRLMLTVLAGMAEFERDLMLERQRAGIARAKAAGKYKGRAPVARDRAAEIARLRAEGLPARAIAAALGIGVRSVYRHAPGSRSAVRPPVKDAGE